jgi:cysteine-rich repeat protein
MGRRRRPAIEDAMHATPTRIALALALGLFAPRADATFHLMKVVEVFAGTPASPNARYVVIQMYAPGQNLVNEHEVTVYNSAGQQVGSFGFTHNVANGANQAKLLIATPEAASFFNVTPDLTMSAVMLAAGGKVCFAGSIDCVAWGAYTGSSTGVGSPFNPAGGITPSRAILRRLDIAGSASVLDAGDDTGNSANDFRFGAPAPRNNAGMLGQAPANTCGNGVIEGLEQCDDDNVASGDGCSSTCAAEAGGTARRVAFDYNGDGRSDLFWRNGSNGANAIWRSANASTSQLVVAVNAAWRLVGAGDVNNDGATDVVWRHSTTGINAIWRSANPATPLPMTGVTNVSWEIAGLGDFNGDGRDDVFWRNGSTGANIIWRSGSSATPQLVRGVTNTDWKVEGIGDFNGDGRADVLWRNGATGANVVWRSAVATSPLAVTGVTNPSWRIAGVGDFNGDGRDDIFWRNVSSGVNVVWRSANSATPQMVARVADTHWNVAAVGDYDGDGRSDVFWRNITTGINAIWRSASAATGLAVKGVTNQAWSVVPYLGEEPEAVPQPQGASLSIADASVTEGNLGSRDATFLVRLSRPSTSPVQYSIATSDGSATAGPDYQATTLAGQVIAPGETSRAFRVAVFGDTQLEAAETFSVAVSGVAGATIADATARGTILDDDYDYGD